MPLRARHAGPNDPPIVTPRAIPPQRRRYSSGVAIIALPNRDFLVLVEFKGRLPDTPEAG